MKLRQKEKNLIHEKTKKKKNGKKIYNKKKAWSNSSLS